MKCNVKSLSIYLGLPDSKAWGIKKSKYYGGDVEDEDLGKCNLIYWLFIQLFYLHHLLRVKMLCLPILKFSLGNFTDIGMHQLLSNIVENCLQIWQPPFFKGNTIDNRIISYVKQLHFFVSFKRSVRFWRWRSCCCNGRKGSSGSTEKNGSRTWWTGLWSRHI